MSASTTTASAAAERGWVWLASTALVGSPLLVLAYFALYPAYGETNSAAIARAITEHPGRTQVADIAGFAGAFLAVPAALAMLRILWPRSPRLAGLGAGLAILGWIALVGVLVVDVVAVEIGDHPALFRDVFDNPVVLSLNGLAGLHVVGAVLLGICLVRTRVIGRPLALAATAAPVVHLSSNLADLFWIDALTWIITALVGVQLARLLTGAASRG